ncbi:MAG: SDR family NAD(P)-dependent oxidoreductase [Chakrabartia sp.]
MTFANKIVLITGASGGIGSATARAFAAAGATLVLTDISGDAVAALAKDIGGTAYAHDVADEARWAEITAATLAAHKRIDVLVNAAGIEGNLRESGLDTSLGEWRRVISTNLDGTFLGCRAVLPAMLAQKTGSIINLSSIVAFMGTPTALAYGASKAGVEQLSRSFALLGAADGAKVRCNSVHPGVIKTRMTDAIFAEFAANTGSSADEVETTLCASIPFGARGVPQNVADLILYLAGDGAAYVTGSAFKVDGGWSVTSAG